MIVEMEVRAWDIWGDPLWIVIASRHKDDKTGAECICTQFARCKFPEDFQPPQINLVTEPVDA